MDGHSFFMGILSLLLLQSFVLAILLLFDRTKANKFLGVFVLVYIHNSIRNSYPIFDYVDSALVLTVVYSLTSTFYYPLLYLYVYEHVRPTGRKQILKHMLLPLFLFVVSMLFYQNKEMLSENIYGFYRLAVNSMLLALSVFYGFLVVRITINFPEWKKLVRTVRKRIERFTYFIFAYFILMMCWIWIQHFIPISDKQNSVVHTVQLPLFIFILLLLPVYSYISLNRFKKYIQPQKILQSSEGAENIKKQIKVAFEVEKLHLNPSFNTGKMAQRLNIKIEDLRILIKNNYDCSVQDYINKMRIEEFKELSQDKNNQVYNIEGLAKNSGFKSRATFYRVFKNIEGVTPLEFISNQ